MRVVNFQLDAASPLFIYSHLDELPFLASKIQDGTSGILFCHGSSSISWTSFWTGHSPHSHGIWGFWNEGASSSRALRVLNEYVSLPGVFLKTSHHPVKRVIKRSLLAARPFLIAGARTLLQAALDSDRTGRRPNNRTDVKRPMGYQILERKGLRVGLVNSIYTYPAWEGTGYVVSDWTMPVGARDYWYPPELGEYLDMIGYGSTLDASKQHWGWLEGSMSDDPDAIYHWATEFFKRVKQVTIKLLQTQAWDFHATMFRILDTIQHVFIDDAERILAAYQMVDRALAEISEAAGLDRAGDIVWLINSDHGMTQYWSDRTVKGGHDLSGFYCFSRPGVFRTNHRHTLRIEDLMSIVLQLYGVESLEIPFNKAQAEFLFEEAAEDASTVDERLRALGYL